MEQPRSGRDFEYDPTIKAGPGVGGFIGEQRLNRKRWWLYSFGGLGVAFGSVLLAALMFDAEAASGLVLLGWFGSYIFWLNLCARRFHDMGRSGWNVLWGFLPLAGPFVLIALCGFEKSDPHPNKWGMPRT